MQEALQLAERYERDCMERAEREQHEAGRVTDGNRVNRAATEQLTCLDSRWHRGGGVECQPGSCRDGGHGRRGSSAQS